MHIKWSLIKNNSLPLGIQHKVEMLFIQGAFPTTFPMTFSFCTYHEYLFFLKLFFSERNFWVTLYTEF